MEEVTSPPSASKAEPEADCTSAKWEIKGIGGLKTSLKVNRFTAGGFPWQLYLRPEQKHPKGFGLYLFLCKGGPVKACIAHMSFTMYDRQEPDNNLYGSITHTYTAALSEEGYVVRAPTPGMVLDDTLVVKLKIRVTMEPCQDAAEASKLREEADRYMAKSFRRMYSDRDNLKTDITLNVGRKQFPAHRVILAAGSPVLQAMFQSDMSDSSSACVEIKEVDVDDMELIMKYLYGTLICVPEERLHSLLLSADRFEVTALRDHCAAELRRSFTVDSVVQVAVLADKISHRRLLDDCLAFASCDENRFTVLDHADLRRLHKSEFEQDRDFAFNFMKDMFRQSSDGWGSGQKRKHAV